MPKEYIEREALEVLMESRKVRGDCKFCAKYERCITNGINRKGSHLYCWEQLKLPTADVAEVIHCVECIHGKERKIKDTVICTKYNAYKGVKGFCNEGESK